MDMSTIRGVTKSSRRSGRRAEELDARLGGSRVAVERTLRLCRRPREEFERVKPVFDVLGDTVVRVGEVGSGQVVKACNQIVVALVIEAVSEALVLGSKAGVVPAKIIEVLSGGLAGNKVMEAKKSFFLEHDFDPGFRVELHHKDLGIALSAAREYGVALPVTAIVDQMLEALVVKGSGDRDHSAILTIREDLAQHKNSTGAFSLAIGTSEGTDPAERSPQKRLLRGE